jgi:uncharacterized protein (TIGR03067 family)
MRPTRLTVTFVVSLALPFAIVAAPAPKDKDDLAKLQGDWTFTSWDQSGVPLNERALPTAKWSVKDNKYTFEIQGVAEEGTIKLDPAKKPATIDLEITAGNDKGQTQLGLYKIDGETVTFCFARPGVKERPTEFKSTEENGCILVTIKKSKKDN